jgi:hypothetical protein
VKEPWKVWCVGHKEGWCATKDSNRFPDSQDHIKTACGYVVTLPLGCEYRVPTCPECRGRRSL